jgi:hypothetical protein
MPCEPSGLLDKVLACFHDKMTRKSDDASRRKMRIKRSTSTSHVGKVAKGNGGSCANRLETRSLAQSWIASIVCHGADKVDRCIPTFPRLRAQTMGALARSHAPFSTVRTNTGKRRSYITQWNFKYTYIQNTDSFESNHSKVIALRNPFATTLLWGCDYTKADTATSDTSNEASE